MSVIAMEKKQNPTSPNEKWDLRIQAHSTLS